MFKEQKIRQKNGSPCEYQFKQWDLKHDDFCFAKLEDQGRCLEYWFFTVNINATIPYEIATIFIAQEYHTVRF